MAAEVSVADEADHVLDDGLERRRVGHVGVANPVNRLGLGRHRDAGIDEQVQRVDLLPDYLAESHGSELDDPILVDVEPRGLEVEHYDVRHGLSFLLNARS